MIRKWYSVAFAAALTLLLAGCGSRPTYPAGAKVESFPVKGRVTVGGRPAAKARVAFHPLPLTPHQPPFTALTDAEGNFQPTTNVLGDGLPHGRYAVTITWPEELYDDSDLEMDKLRGRYNNKPKPPFTVDVKAGSNTDLPPFELK